MGSVNNKAPHEIMPLTDEQAQALLAGLEQLRDKGPVEYLKIYGICKNLREIINEEACTYTFVSTYSLNWSNHAGEHEDYPVDDEGYEDKMWDNPLRLELVSYLISILEERLYCSKP